MSATWERIQARGGLRAVITTPFRDRSHQVIGWQNVVVCADGTRVGLSPAEEAEQPEPWESEGT